MSTGLAIFLIYLTCGAFYHIFNSISRQNEKGTTSYKVSTVLKWTAVGIVSLLVLIGICYVIGWIWYYFCCGFLLFEDMSAFDKICCGFLSLVLLAFVFGGIAVIFGWDPNR